METFVFATLFLRRVSLSSHLYDRLHHFNNISQFVREGVFANIFPGGDICQLLVKILAKTGKRPFCIKNILIYVKKKHEHADVVSF